MCICAFAGERSWGYEGVQWFAPDSTYGRPEDLKAFVDAAHARGIMVLLDVVYNHFGPEGNYIPRYFPEIFSEEHKTAWGAALNFDGPHCREVREFVVESALFWVEEFHVDGLRLDASHALIDNSPKHILDEISERVQAAAGERQVHLILENEQAIGRLLKRDAGGETLYRAQWNHAVDHIIGLAMSGDCAAANEQRRHETEELAHALAEGFFAGDVSCSAEDSATIPPTAFVDFTQTHDLVGNRAFGERLCMLASPEATRAATAVVLLAPQIPMLFMGEEWAATSPFPFFSDFGGELGEAVRRGRCEQIKRESHVDDATLARVPNPQAESTFLSAKLPWEELDDPAHRERVDWCRRVLAVRRERIIALLDGLTDRCGRYEVFGPGQFVCEWKVKERGMLRLIANLCAAPSSAFQGDSDEHFWLEGSQTNGGELGPWSVRWSFQANATVR
jgi:malto-oligosyltrehalose trehalohydrolase